MINLSLLYWFAIIFNRTSIAVFFFFIALYIYIFLLPFPNNFLFFFLLSCALLFGICMYTPAFTPPCVFLEMGFLSLL